MKSEGIAQIGVAVAKHGIDVICNGEKINER